jgi:hypothetical protein
MIQRQPDFDLIQKLNNELPPEALLERVLTLMDEAWRETDPERFVSLVWQAREVASALTGSWPLSLLSRGPDGSGQVIATTEQEKLFLPLGLRAKALPRPASPAGVAAGVVGLDLPPSPEALRTVVEAVRGKLRGRVREDASGPVPLGSPAGAAGVAISARINNESLYAVVAFALEGGFEYVPIEAAGALRNEVRRHWRRLPRPEQCVEVEAEAGRGVADPRLDRRPDKMVEANEFTRAVKAVKPLPVEATPAHVRARQRRLKKLRDGFRGGPRRRKG